MLISVGLLAFIIVSNLNGSPQTDDAAGVEVAAVATEIPAATMEEPAAVEEPAAEPEAAPAPVAGTATNLMPQPYVAEGLLGGDKCFFT